MNLTLRIIKTIHALKVRIGIYRLPRWIREAFDLFDYINILKTINTYCIIFLSPTHFFKIIPVLTGSSSNASTTNLYLTPFKFFTSSVVVQLLIIDTFIPIDSHPAELLSKHLSFSYSPSDRTVVYAANMVAAALSPLIIAATCIAIFIAWWLLRRFQIIGNIVDFFQLNYHGTLIPIDYRTYIDFDWARYICSMMYYYIYFYFSIILFFFVMSLGLEEMYDIHSYLEGGKVIHFNRLTIIPYLIYAYIGVRGAFRIFIKPYIFLLMSCAKEKTHEMNKYIHFEKYET